MHRLCFPRRGSIHLGRPGVAAIVGARNASINAQRLAQALAEDLSTEGYVIISGLARGIDAAAHNGALSSGTIAVIAGGIDVVYPSENTDLQESIAEAGLVLAEMPPEHSRRHGIFRSETASSAALPLVPSLLKRRNGQARSSPHGKQRNAAAKSWPFQARRSTRAHGGATI